MVFGLPILCYLFTFVCNDIAGCPVPSLLSPSTLTIEALKQEVGWPEAGIRGLANWDVSAKVLGYYALSLVLHRVLPGEEVEGTELVSGGRLKYKFNSAFLASGLNLHLLTIYSMVIYNGHPLHPRCRNRTARRRLPRMDFYMEQLPPDPHGQYHNRILPGHIRLHSQLQRQARQC